MKSKFKHDRLDVLHAYERKLHRRTDAAPGDIVLMNGALLDDEGDFVIEDNQTHVAFIVAGPHRRPEPWSEWAPAKFEEEEIENIFTVIMSGMIGYTWNNEIIRRIK